MDQLHVRTKVCKNCDNTCHFVALKYGHIREDFPVSLIAPNFRVLPCNLL